MRTLIIKHSKSTMIPHEPHETLKITSRIHILGVLLNRYSPCKLSQFLLSCNVVKVALQRTVLLIGLSDKVIICFEPVCLQNATKMQ